MPVVVERDETVPLDVNRVKRRECNSKSLRNLKAAVSLHFAWYNFVRIHRSLRCTPAMEAGVTGRLWDLEELLDYELPY